MRGDPLLSLRECAVADCAASTTSKEADLCATCRKRWKASDLPWEDFLAGPCGGRPQGGQPCLISDCPRPARSAERLCGTHAWQRQRHRDLPVERWAARPDVGPLPSFGSCIAASCAAAAAHRCGLCAPHRTAWCRHRGDHDGAVLAEWARQAAPADVAGHEITLRGLPDRVIAELLAGLQRRTDAGLRTPPTSTRYLVKLLHAQQADSLLDLAQVPSTAIRSDARQLLRSLATELYCLLSGPEKERARDIWQLQVFGLAGKLDFTGITQRWLRESVKWWAAEDLPLRRGREPADSARDTIRAAVALSASLRLACDDGGHDPAALGREDIVAGNLDVLEKRCGISERRITEILIDTGRRPDEVCTLEWDCLERDPSGDPVLIYTDAKNNRPGQRLPIAYRHSYAQRHADAGVQPDVLRELMSHRSMRTTTGYYRITESRLRAAVDKVARHQFNAAGQRVFTSIAGLLSDEHARMRIGQVAVPFGICTEPSNVKAGGHACPYKYTCTGCGHFRSDPSYLPELKSYLQQLLADRERLQAATGLQPWARAQVTPPDEQVSQVRDLIRRIEADMDALSDADRAQIQQAVAAIRAARQTVMLGMPAIRPAAGNR